MGFGKLLGAKLKEKGIRQADLADNIGITRTTLNSMIKRDTAKIENETFLKICKYIGSDPEEFYDYYIRETQKPLPPEFVEKYNALDSHGKRMVDFTLNEEFDRLISLNSDCEDIYPQGSECRCVGKVLGKVERD